MSTSTPYEMLIAANSELSESVSVEEVVDGDLKRIESYVEANSDALASAREAIRMNPVVPFRYELAVDLTVRSYRFANSSFPDSLESLTDVGLPMDPFTDQPFRYRKHLDDSFSIYSVGPRRVDHEGRFGSQLMVNAGLADLCLDVADFSLDCCTIEAPQRGIFSRVAGVLEGVWTTLATMTSPK